MMLLIIIVSFFNFWKKMSIDEIQANFVANFNANPRLHWTPSLHQRFVNVVNELGGPLEAKPKAIRDRMGVPQLTIRHIKSHLQKYRASPQEGGARSRADVSNGQLECDDNATFPKVTFPNDIGGNENFDVSKLQIGIEGIPYLVPASYDNGGQGVYDVSEEIPFVVPAPDVIRSHEVEEIPHSVHASYDVGNYEAYHPQGIQRGMQQIQEPKERYTHKNTDVGCKKDTGKKLEASACTMQYSDDFLAFLNWETAPYANWGNEVYNEPTSLVYNEPTSLLETEEEARTALQEYQNYIASLDNVNNKKGKGTMEVQPQARGCSTDNMPSGHMLSTPYGMGGHGIYDASSVQRGLEDGVRQGSTVEKHAMIREDGDNRYTNMDQAFNLTDSDWLNLMTSHPSLK